MKKIVPRLVKGMRDYAPADMELRENMIATITGVFKKYGLQALQTPALEYWELLTAKSGEEATALTYHLTDRGDRELGLRYDLTVPVSRFIAMNKQIPFPFKRYQIQDVWRADKPQRGRFREFLQCDFDIIGTDSPYADAEIIAILNDCFQALGIEDAVVLMNSRPALKSVFLAAGCTDDLLDQSCRIIDKHDKIGTAGVLQEYEANNFDAGVIERLKEFLENAGNDATEGIGNLPWFTPDVEKYFQEVQNLYEICLDFGVPSDNIRISPILSRGLDYYTGPVFEVHLAGETIGSLAGGGRYDGLIGYFSNTDIPATGASIGIDRTLTVLKDRSGKSDSAIAKGVLVGVFDEKFRKDSLNILRILHENNIESETVYQVMKLKKQFEYANKHGFRLFCFRGPEEMNNRALIIKNLVTGVQVTVPENELVQQIKSVLAQLHD